MEAEPADDAAEDDAEGYRVAPLPETYGRAESPAYRPAPPPSDDDTYAIGGEVENAEAFSVGSQCWREAAAGVRRETEPFDLADDPLPAAPAEHRTARLREIERRAAKETAAQVVRGEDPFRFTLRSLFLLVTAAAAIFALGRRVERPIFAGITGAAAFITLLAVGWFRRGSVFSKTVWWTLLLIYLVTAVFAALGL